MTVTLQPNGCMDWTGYIGNHGYGVKSVANRPTLVHRYAYEMCVGPIPAGKLVCHECDNRRCVNPNHLFLGTIEDNTADMVRKSRQARGEHHSQAKLTEEIVAEIRHECSTGVTQKNVAKFYGVSEGTISLIVNRKIWNFYGSNPAA